MDILLDSLIWPESKGEQWAVSYKGPQHGRGYFMVSEIMYTQYKWFHPDVWFVRQNLGPEALFNSNVGREVARYAIVWLSDYYNSKGKGLYYVITAYNCGISNTDAGMRSDKYYSEVMDEVRKRL